MVSTAERPRGFGEQDSERASADSGQGGENGHIVRCALLRLGRMAQGSAEFVEFSFGLVELTVHQAQSGDERVQVQNGCVGDTTGHLDRGLT